MFLLLLFFLLICILSLVDCQPGYEFPLSTNSLQKFSKKLQDGEFVYIPIPIGYGVLEYDFQIVAADGWPNPTDAKIDAYIFENITNGFQNYQEQSGIFFPQIGSQRNQSFWNLNNLHFHSNRSQFEDDYGPPRQFVFVLDNTDRDNNGAVPPQNSLVDIQFSVRFRATDTPAKVTQCENNLHVHEGQFVYAELRGPAVFNNTIEVEFHCAHENGNKACEYQNVLVDKTNFDRYIASELFYTLKPEWDVGMANASVSISGVEIEAGQVAYWIVRRFRHAPFFDDQNLYLSFALESAANACPPETFAPRPAPPPPIEAAKPVPSGCDKLKLISRAFCASQCSGFCEAALCDQHAAVGCALNGEENMFESQCNRKLKCFDTSPTPMPTTTSFDPFSTEYVGECNEMYKLACDNQFTRCIDLAVEEEPTNPTPRTCKCAGALASCLPESCDSQAQRQSCYDDVACSKEQCDTKAPLFNTGPPGATQTPAATSTPSTMMGGNNTPQPSSAPGNSMSNSNANTPANGAPTTSNNTPTTTNDSNTSENGNGSNVPGGCTAAPLSECEAKCGSRANIQQCSCATQTCFSDNVVVSGGSHTMWFRSVLLFIAAAAALQ